MKEKAMQRPFQREIKLFSDHPKFKSRKIVAVADNSMGVYLSNPTQNQKTQKPDWRNCHGWFYWQLGDRPSVRAMDEAATRYARYWEWLASQDFSPLDPLFPEALQEAANKDWNSHQWEFPYVNNVVVSSFRFDLFEEDSHEVGYLCYVNDNDRSVRVSHTVNRDGSAIVSIAEKGKVKEELKYRSRCWGVERSWGSSGSRGGWWIVD
jgi:hypothetical protein